MQSLVIEFAPSQPTKYLQWSISSFLSFCYMILRLLNYYLENFLCFIAQKAYKIFFLLSVISQKLFQAVVGGNTNFFAIPALLSRPILFFPLKHCLHYLQNAFLVPIREILEISSLRLTIWKIRITSSSKCIALGNG